MKRSDAIKQIREHENATEVKRLEKLHELQAKLDIENRESNLNRARSITVGTAFGGTSEILMRGDGGRHLWCVMQPVEVIELIHQLAANVGCNAQLTPRRDFASWRDWRVSEAEKKHLNGHAPFVNDMAMVQNLGRTNYNDENVKQIMDAMANIQDYVNENDDAKIALQDTKIDGAPSIMFGEEDGLIHNKLKVQDGEVVYMTGGSGGDPVKAMMEEDAKNTVAAKKSKNR